MTDCPTVTLTDWGCSVICGATGGTSEEPPPHPDKASKPVPQINPVNCRRVVAMVVTGSCLSIDNFSLPLELSHLLAIVAQPWSMVQPLLDTVTRAQQRSFRHTRSVSRVGVRHKVSECSYGFTGPRC